LQNDVSEDYKRSFCLLDHELKSEAKIHEKFSAYTKMSAFEGNSSMVEAYKRSPVLR